MVAEAVALLVGTVVLLVDDDQSAAGKGVKMAERVPRTTQGWPQRAGPDAARSPSDRPECRAITVAPRRWR